jgi:uroporphyrinogen III methyltransferase/synthase
MSGHVAIIGAGPGDPGLLTLRGAALLGEADVIVHDRLVSDEVLALAPQAERIDVGKMPGGVSASQSAINATLVELGLAGKRVVRVKGGDPYIFGRGSEERAACLAAGVAVEVVPGITSAIAGPASVGIPVTERGIARSCAIVTARTGDGAPEQALPFDALAAMDTVVVLMGRERLGDIVAGLLRSGRSPETPAALIERATWLEERAVRGTLASIEAIAKHAAIEAPAVLVIGTVARERDERRDRRPLEGRRIVVTRPAGACRDLVARLRSLGACVLHAPLIAMHPLRPAPALPELGAYRWIVLTSLHGVAGFAAAIEAAGLDGRSLHAQRIAAVGPRTARELRERTGLRADLVPSEHRAHRLVEAIGREARPGERVLFPCGTLAREETAAGLRGIGLAVDEWRVYATERVPPSDRVLQAIRTGVDAVLLYSPSAVEALAGATDSVGAAHLICVGPTTADAVRRAGLGVPSVAASYGDDGVIDRLHELLGQQIAAERGIA